VEGLLVKLPYVSGDSWIFVELKPVWFRSGAQSKISASQSGISIARLPSLEVVPLGLTGKPQLWYCNSSYLLVTPKG
jgi:hypothetical protein